MFFIQDTKYANFLEKNLLEYELWKHSIIGNNINFLKIGTVGVLDIRKSLFPSEKKVDPLLSCLNIT